MQQTYMSAHGSGASQTTVQVDGLMVNGLDGDGAVQNYFNSSMSQEMVYTTSGASADVSGGGVRLNMIPRDGGNTLNGSVFGGYQNKSFQTDNLTDELKARGLKSADGIDKLSNFEGVARRPDQEGQGLVLRVGPHVPPRHAAGRRVQRVGDADGSPDEPASIRRSINSVQARIIWQISQKNKLSVYNDRLGKNRGAAMTAGFDPATASHRLELADLHDRLGQVHLDGDATRSCVEGGFSTNYERYNMLYQPGIEKERGTPEWYTTINKQDTALGTHWNAGATQQGMYPDRFAVAGVGVVRHRRAQHQGRRPGHLGPLPPVPQRQRRPARVLPERRAVPGRRS